MDKDQPEVKRMTARPYVEEKRQPVCVSADHGHSYAGDSHHQYAEVGDGELLGGCALAAPKKGGKSGDEKRGSQHQGEIAEDLSGRHREPRQILGPKRRHASETCENLWRLNGAERTPGSPSTVKAR